MSLSGTKKSIKELRKNHSTTTTSTCHATLANLRQHYLDSIPSHRRKFYEQENVSDVLSQIPMKRQTLQDALEQFPTLVHVQNELPEHLRLDNEKETTTETQVEPASSTYTILRELITSSSDEILESNNLNTIQASNQSPNHTRSRNTIQASNQSANHTRSKNTIQASNQSPNHTRSKNTIQASNQSANHTISSQTAEDSAIDIVWLGDGEMAGRLHYDIDNCLLNTTENYSPRDSASSLPRVHVDNYIPDDSDEEHDTLEENLERNGEWTSTESTEIINIGS